MSNLTKDERAINHSTWTHIHQIQKLLNIVIKELMRRQLEHDQSKLRPPEVEAFTRMTPILKHLEYGSSKYKESIKQLGPAIDHHYSIYRHHPEHFKNGIDDMNLIDILEMVIDWRAATVRGKNGDIYKSIEIQRDKLKINDQLFNVILNTVDYLESEINDQRIKLISD